MITNYYRSLMYICAEATRITLHKYVSKLTTGFVQISIIFIDFVYQSLAYNAMHVQFLNYHYTYHLPLMHVHDTPDFSFRNRSSVGNVYLSTPGKSARQSRTSNK